MNDNKSRPAVTPAEIAIDRYEVVFLGYPIWWDLAPRIVNSFIESHDFSGKKNNPLRDLRRQRYRQQRCQAEGRISIINWAEGRILNDTDTENICRWVEDMTANNK